MANVYAVKNGNWSDTTLWNTGSLPTTVDDVFANTFTVYVDGNYRVLSVQNLSATSITRGGSFILNNGISLSANVIGGGNTNIFCVRFLSASPSFATLVGSVSTNGALVNVQNAFALELSSTGTLTVFGSALGGVNNGSGTGVSDGYIQVNAPGTLNIFGDVQGSLNGNVYYGINNKAAGTVNVVGNVTGRTVAAAGVSLHVINNASTGTINVTGNVFAGVDNTNYGINNASNGPVNVRGNIRGGSGVNAHGINNALSGLITVFGNVSGSPFATGGVGIYNATTGRSNVVGNVYGGLSNHGIAGNVNTTVVNITGNVFGGSGSNIHGIALPYGSIVTVYGDVYGGTGGTCTGFWMNNSTGYPPMTAIVIGNIISGTGSGSSGIASGTTSNLGPNIITIVGNISAAGGAGLSMSSGAAFVTGNTFGSNTGSNAGTNITSASATIIGNSYGGLGSNAYGLILGNNSFLTLFGSCFAGPGGGSNGGQNNGATSTLIVTGSAYASAANSASGVFNNSTGTIIVSGSVVGHGRGGNNAGAWNVGTGTIIIGGAAIGGNFGNTGYGAHNQGSGILRVKRAVGNDWGLGYTQAVAATVGVFSNAQTSQTFVEELQCGSRGQWPTAGVIFFTPNTKATSQFETDTFQNYSLIQTNSADNLIPPVSSVRQGTVYDLGTDIGTCIIPPVSSVAAGTLVDNLTGTATLTPQTTWNYPVTASDVNSMGGRLRNALNTNSANSLIDSFNP